MSLNSVAVIGSFRHTNYGKVVETIRTFRAAGLVVKSPSGADIVSGVEFVRFASDREDASDAEIQTATLENIFAADAVYVVTGPSGYVGKTTCYEIGRIVQRKQPIYFFEHPDDLPVHIPSEHVARPEEFVLRFLKSGEKPSWLYESQIGEIFDGERRLVSTSTFK